MRVLKWSAFSFVALCVVAVCAFVWWADHPGRPWMENIVRKRLDQAMTSATVTGYHLHIDSLTTDLWKGDVRITGVELAYDSTLNDSLVSGAYKYLFAAEAGTIELRGLSYWRLLLLREFHVNKLVIDRPLLNYSIGNEKVLLSAPFNRLKKPKGRPLALFDIDSVVVSNAQGLVRDLSGRLPVMHASGLHAEVDHVRITHVKGRSRSDLDVGQVMISLDSLSTEISAHYRLRLGRVLLSDRTHSGSVRTLSLEHVDDSTSTAQPALRSTVMDIHVDSLAMRGIDIGKLVGDQALSMSSLTVHALHFNGRLDKNAPVGPSSYMPLPPAALQALRFVIKIDTVRMLNSDIRYQELSAETQEWGALSFAHLQAEATGINNGPDDGYARPDIDVNVNCSLFDTAALVAHYTAASDSSGNFLFDATVTDLPFVALNVATVPLLRVVANDGRLQRMHLVMKGNDQKAKGNMELAYTGLHATVARTATREQRHSMFGDLLEHALSPDNGGGLSDDRKRSYVVEREQDRSLFTYIWAVTRTGLTRDLLPGARERVKTVLRKEHLERQQRRQERRARK